MSDRLSQIKARWENANPAAWRYNNGQINGTAWPHDVSFIVNASDDIDYLLGKVERFRTALEQIADDGVEGYESPQKRIALAALDQEGEAK